MQAFLDLVKAEPGVTGVETAPMLRGRIVKVKDVAADKVQLHARCRLGVARRSRPHLCR